MPATEQTWRNVKTMHVVFAVSSVLLLITTVWMLMADHQRSWKEYQRQARDVEVWYNQSRQVQYATGDAMEKHDKLASQLAAVQAQSFNKEVLEQFKQAVREDDESYSFASLDLMVQELDELAEAAQAARADADTAAATASGKQRELDLAKLQVDTAKRAFATAKDPDAASAAIATAEQAVETASSELEELNSTARAEAVAATEAEAAAARQRTALIDKFETIIRTAKFRENLWLGRRKFRAADRDAKVAALGIQVNNEEDPAVQNETQEEINVILADLAQLTEKYQQASAHRKKLESLLAELRAPETAVATEFAANQSELKTLQTAFKDQRGTYFVNTFPYLGKRWLELPILDAFNSPLSIDTLWSDGNEIDYNFRRVRRFDRCTTCHQAIDKTRPGSAVEPAYVHQEEIELVLLPPDKLPAEKVGSDGKPQPRTLESVYGFRLTSQGVLDGSDATVSFVRVQTPAAKAPVAQPASATAPETGEQLVDALRYPQPHSEDASTEAQAGLMMGDVLEAIDGDPVRDAQRAAFRLVEAAERKEVVHLTVRRGLPHPFASHPRLDLYVGSLSPHKKAEFGCTICHEGQGSATEFKWVSHTPNDSIERRDWEKEYGWFDNHHWIYPMLPDRFVESSCLKCHHEVVDLEPSERFPEAPAPKLMHGYNLMRKYGCYGCHEVNGYDGPDKRVGPDLRTEPNFFAAAQQLTQQPGYEKLEAGQQDWVQQLIQHPERDGVRHRLLELLKADQQKPEAEQTFSNYVHQKLVTVLNDVDVPGKLRKAGPALRFVSHKNDYTFLYDWVANPKNFRPSTRMPRFFGLYKHLQGFEEDLDKAKRRESVEIEGMVTYLLNKSQPFEYLPRPEWSVATDAAQREVQVERGKVLFQTRGCLACHTHKDFPDATAMNKPGYIVQGPDLSGMGDKLNPQRNPLGPKWLYTWLKNPTSYHVRTVMPNVFLTVIEDKDGNKTDPAADIVEYLLTSSKEGWKPAPGTPEAPEDVNMEHVDELLKELLVEVFYQEEALQFAASGIPMSRAGELKGAEAELLVPEADAAANKPLALEQKLVYLGRKAIAKHGCYGCHDIPGFEDAKPIGTGLADWGRKDPSKLAFEHIGEYLEAERHGGHSVAPAEGNGTANAAAEEPADSHAADSHAADSHAEEADAVSHGTQDELPDFYRDAIYAGHRAGFIYQKLREPRSYDYHKTHNKKYGDWLRMPQFPFDHEDREAIITFVLGLVADPPEAKFVYQPEPRQADLIAGRKVLEKYNCAGCHVLQGERWTINYPTGSFGPPNEAASYPFLEVHMTPDQLAASQAEDRRGLSTTVLEGMPAVSESRGQFGLPIISDEEGDPLEPEESYDPRSVAYSFQLWKPASLDGQVYDVGGNSLIINARQIVERRGSNGGYLAKYLLPHVADMERQVNPNAKASEAWAWLPPPLIGEGRKVRSDWLHDFLLNPYPIRPAVVLRMPRFNMSSEEATALSAYFAAVDQVDFPYQYRSADDAQRLAELNQEYQSRTGHTDMTRLQAAMRIVTDKNYCIKCHIVADFHPEGSDRAKAPNLADVYRRLRPEYTRDWIANPKRLLPYTAMPVNIVYKPRDPSIPENEDTLGGVSQDLYHGTSVQQLDGLVDLLMNYDVYTKQRSEITPLVKANAAAGAESPDAAAGESNPAASSEPGAAAKSQEATN